MTKEYSPRLVAKHVVSNRKNLCDALSVDISRFEEMLGRPIRYKPIPILKKNRIDYRQVYSPDWDVRVLLRRFNRRFFANSMVVRWPYFLYGCVPRSVGDSDGRDYIACARVHSNARSLLKVDIANFFPSITEEWVRSVFSRFLRFPDGLARDMARLNCVDGVLVQGSPCASYIAGAIFNVEEGRLVRRLESKGYRYTRYVDDITVSSVRRGESYALATRLIDDVFAQHDLERNVEKTAIMRSGTAPLLVHGIRVGSGKVGLPRDEFKAIRSAVRSIENYALSKDFRSSLHYRRMYMRCVGLVGKLARTGDLRSRGYFLRLKKIRPISTQEDIDLCREWVSEVERKAKSRSNYYFHIRQVHRTWARLSILAWTYPREAGELRARLKGHLVEYGTIKI